MTDVGPDQEHRLARRDQPVRGVRPEGAAGTAELERAEHPDAEVAGLAGRLGAGAARLGVRSSGRARVGLLGLFGGGRCVRCTVALSPTSRLGARAQIPGSRQLAIRTAKPGFTTRFPAVWVRRAAGRRPRQRRVRRSRPYNPRHGPRAHRAAQRLAAAVREPLPRLLLARPSGDPGGRLRPGHRRLRLAGRRRRLQRRRVGRLVRDRPPDLDPDRVLAAPARLPLGARSSRSAAAPLHHARRPPRPPERSPAAGHAAGRQRSRSRFCSCSPSTPHLR